MPDPIPPPIIWALAVVKIRPIVNTNAKPTITLFISVSFRGFLFCCDAIPQTEFYLVRFT
jgi:hypothetical protein